MAVPKRHRLHPVARWDRYRAESRNPTILRRVGGPICLRYPPAGVFALPAESSIHLLELAAAQSDTIGLQPEIGVFVSFC